MWHFLKTKTYHLKTPKQIEPACFKACLAKLAPTETSCYWKQKNPSKESQLDIIHKRRTFLIKFYNFLLIVGSTFTLRSPKEVNLEPFMFYFNYNCMKKSLIFVLPWWEDLTVLLGCKLHSMHICSIINILGLLLTFKIGLKAVGSQLIFPLRVE